MPALLQTLPKGRDKTVNVVAIAKYAGPLHCFARGRSRMGRPWCMPTWRGKDGDLKLNGSRAIVGLDRADAARGN